MRRIGNSAPLSAEEAELGPAADLTLSLSSILPILRGDRTERCNILLGLGEGVGLGEGSEVGLMVVCACASPSLEPIWSVQSSAHAMHCLDVSSLPMSRMFFGELFADPEDSPATQTGVKVPEDPRHLLLESFVTLFLGLE